MIDIVEEFAKIKEQKFDYKVGEYSFAEIAEDNMNNYYNSICFNFNGKDWFPSYLKNRKHRNVRSDPKLFELKTNGTNIEFDFNTDILFDMGIFCKTYYFHLSGDVEQIANIDYVIRNKSKMAIDEHNNSYYMINGKKVYDGITYNFAGEKFYDGRDEQDLFLKKEYCFGFNYYIEKISNDKIHDADDFAILERQYDMLTGELTEFKEYYLYGKEYNYEDWLVKSYFVREGLEVFL
jgi:hypothetical protein